MERVSQIKWPHGANELIAARIPLPSPCTLNQTALVLGDGEVAVFLQAGREPVVLREGTQDLSFELDGLMSGLAQLFYSRPYEGQVWVVRTADVEVGWSVQAGDTEVSGKLWVMVTDPTGLLEGREAHVRAEELAAWMREAWVGAYGPLARRVAESVLDGTWEDAAMEAEALLAQPLAERGVGITLRSDLETRAAEPDDGGAPEPVRPPPSADACLLHAMALVGALAEAGQLVFADGMVPEQASIALADRLLAGGIHVDAEGAPAIWAALQEIPGVLAMMAFEDLVARVELVSA